MRDITLLIADDEPGVRLFVRQLVERERAPVSQVFEAANGREAVELACRHKPDLVLLDIRMPELDGLQAAQAILQQCPELCVVIASAHEDFDYARTALRAGVADYLLKPVRVAEILERIHKVHTARNTSDESYVVSHPLVAAVAAYVAQHLCDVLDLRSIGKAVFVSPSHLSRVFKKQTGMALVDFVLEQRLAEAKTLLTRTLLSIAEIAEQTGFSSPAYFSACFRKKNGLSPSGYRRSCREDASGGQRG